MFYYFVFLLIVCEVSNVVFAGDKIVFKTMITTNESTWPKENIRFPLPRHLYIGRCKRREGVIHEENVVFNNDKKSFVRATVRVDINNPAYISCAKILDQAPYGEGGYPSYVGGGVGKNYVIFNVTTEYGKGFNFFVQINGYSKK